MITEQLISECKNELPAAQKQLYEQTYHQMYMVVQRYVQDTMLAEDVSIEAYIKVFKNLDKFRNEGPIEAWMRKIFVNEALMALRKSKRIQFDEINENHFGEMPVFEDDTDVEIILNLIETLPEGCKTVFKLYVLDEFQHNEIAEQLGISISTSKSQYQLAKTKLKTMLEKNTYNE